MRIFARAQGATEYLVLLAVVLIVALVSVALLGFFPGMASDSQITQSQMYWQSATPISIIESAARVNAPSGITYPYLRIRNSGTYPIRITAIIGGDGSRAPQFASSNCGVVGNANISDYYYMEPGDERYFAWIGGFDVTCNWQVTASTSSSTGQRIGGASSVCQNSSASPGVLEYKSLGFEYIEYIEGQQITKRQIGNDLVVKCMEPMN